MCDRDGETGWLAFGNGDSRGRSRVRPSPVSPRLGGQQGYMSLIVQSPGAWRWGVSSIARTAIWPRVRIGTGPAKLLYPAQPAGKPERQQRSEDWYADRPRHSVVPVEIFIPGYTFPGGTLIGENLTGLFIRQAVFNCPLGM